MSRSRSFNRFHRYLARQKRRGLRAVLPQFKDAREHQESSADAARYCCILLGFADAHEHPGTGAAQPAVRGVSAAPGSGESG